MNLYRPTGTDKRLLESCYLINFIRNNSYFKVSAKTHKLKSTAVILLESKCKIFKLLMLVYC